MNPLIDTLISLTNKKENVGCINNLKPGTCNGGVEAPWLAYHEIGSLYILASIRCFLRYSNLLENVPHFIKTFWRSFRFWNIHLKNLPLFQVTSLSSCDDSQEILLLLMNNLLWKIIIQARNMLNKKYVNFKPWREDCWRLNINIDKFQNFHSFHFIFSSIQLYPI